MISIPGGQALGDHDKEHLMEQNHDIDADEIEDLEVDGDEVTGGRLYKRAVTVSSNIKPTTGVSWTSAMHNGMFDR